MLEERSPSAALVGTACISAKEPVAVETFSLRPRDGGLLSHDEGDTA